MIPFIGTLLTLSSMIWLVKIFIIIKTRENISHLIDNGILCSSCKDEIDEVYFFDEQKGTIEFVGKRQCTSCKRESALNEIIGKKKTKIFDFIYSKNWHIIFILMTISSIIFQLLNIFLHIPFLTIVGGLILNYANYSNYLNIKYTTRPKKTQSLD